RWIALGGVDSEIGLWDLGLIRDELAAVGLAWDQSAPPVASAARLASAKEHRRSSVPLIRAGKFDPAEFDKARRLVNSGVAAFQSGRFADAVNDLQQAGERLETLRHPLPLDPVLARSHAICVGFLGSTLRDLGR